MNAHRRLLVVEDHHPLRLALRVYFREHGFAVSAVSTAEEAIEAVHAEPPHVAVVDWNLPGKSGLWLVEQWRSAAWRTIVLSARSAVEDRVTALDRGAHDYVVKPFSNEELLARVRVQLRDRAHADALIELSGVSINLARQEGRRDGVVFSLTTKEVELLRFLVANPGRSLSREELLREVWGYRTTQTRALDNTMLRLRGKVEHEAGRPRHLLTVHGVGYRFEL